MSSTVQTNPTLERDRHHFDANAEKVVLLLNDGGNYVEASGNANGVLDVSGGAGGGGTQYAEDAVAASGDTGTLALVVRNDLGTTNLADTNGDYSAIAVDARGGVIGAADKQHNTATSAADMGTQIMGVRNDDAAASLTSSNLFHSEVSLDIKGRQHVTGSTGMVALKTDGSAVTQPVSGTVAISGTVPVSAAALPLPTGASTEATLAAAAASLAVLDDWDESDRAKVNPIAGQAGVQGGPGAVTVLTQRVVLATDVALPAGTNAIGKLAANSGVDIGDVDILTMPNGAVAGTTAHDAAGGAVNPLAVGAYATDYEPDATGPQGPTDVSADADVARVSVNRKGEVVTAVRAEYDVPTNIATTFNNTTTVALSAAIECHQYRQCSFGFSLVSAGSGTHFISVEILVSLDNGANFHKLMNGPLSAWTYDDTICASGINRALTFPIACHSIKVNVQAVNTSASLTFTISNPAIYFRT